MDPATLMMLLQGVKAVGEGVTGFVNADQSFGRSEEARLKSLQRGDELGTLGYTDTERERMLRELLNPVQGREYQRDIQNRGIIGASDGSATTGAISSMLAADAAEASRARAGETYLQAQIGEQTRQREELKSLEKAKDSEEKAKTSAILGALTGGLAGGAEAAQRGALQTEMLAGQAVADTRRAGGTDAGVTRALTQEQLDEAMGLLGYVPGSY